jgi:TonB family protein
MNPIEQSLPLTEAERAVLGSKRKRALILAPVMAAGSILLLLFLVGLILVEVYSLFLITLLLISLGFGLKALLSTITLFRLNRDLRAGQKRFVNAPVEAQDIDVPSGGGGADAYTFWIKAGGRKIAVSEEQYYQVKKGDTVLAYVAPHSGVVFGLSKGAELSAEERAQPAVSASQLVPARKPMSKTKKRLLLAGVSIVVVGVVFLAVVGIAIMIMPAQTYNRLNPFAPKPPAGAFAENIGGYRQSTISYSDLRRYGSGYLFSAYYNSPDGKTIEYGVTDYASPEKVKERMSGSYHVGNATILQRSDARVAAIGLRDAIVLLAAGQRLIRISGPPANVIEFENKLPYAAFGLNQSPARTAEEFKNTTAPSPPRAVSSDTVEVGIVNNMAVNLVQPPYSALARSAKASGEVRVQVLIDENGNVAEARALSGHVLLQNAAVQAARASRFTPTEVSGQRVKVRGVIKYEFKPQ